MLAAGGNACRVFHPSFKPLRRGTSGTNSKSVGKSDSNLQWLRMAITLHRRFSVKSNCCLRAATSASRSLFLRSSQSTLESSRILQSRGTNNTFTKFEVFLSERKTSLLRDIGVPLFVEFRVWRREKIKNGNTLAVRPARSWMWPYGTAFLRLQ
jgi:hypothetical protein